MKLSRVKGFRLTEIERWSKHHLNPYSEVISDGHSCFSAVVKAQCSHQVHVVHGGKNAVSDPAFKWVNILLGNVKNSLRATYHNFSVKYIPRYLAEYQYRFNRRFDLKSIVLRLAFAAIHTQPMPMRLLTMAEKEW